jgi:polar amino acid transport system permease protein
MSDRSPPQILNKRRFTKWDFVLLGVLIFILAYIVHRIDTVLVYHWNWPRVLGYLAYIDEKTGHLVPNLLLSGLATTIRLSFWGTILASLIGMIMGYWRTCDTLALRLISRIYVECIRNIPPVVFIFIFYFFIASQFFPALGLDHIDIDSPIFSSKAFYIAFGDPKLFSNFLVGLLCLSFFEAAYITEIVRAGIQSVPRGQWDAGKALGFSKFYLLVDVIFPQAIRKILPPLAGQFISLIKDSSIVSLISVQELSFLASEVSSSTTKVFETWILVGALYFSICYAFSFLFSWMEKRASSNRR